MSALAAYLWERRSEILSLTGEHLVLVLLSTAAAVAIDIAMKLLMSFSMWPWPGGPAWMTFSQYAEITGFRRANVASSAPTIVLSRPSSASFGVRASGAST